MNDLSAHERLLLGITSVIVGGILTTQAVAAEETAYFFEILIGLPLWFGGMHLGVKAMVDAWRDLRAIKKELLLLEVIPPLFENGLLEVAEE